LNGTGGPYIDWNKPTTYRQIPYVIHTLKLKKLIS
jgi:hypothetical protein